MTDTPTHELHDRVAFITGAASGIGAGAAKHLAKFGARVAAIDLNEDDLQQVVDAITSEGGDALAIQCDVTQPDQVDAAVAQTIDRFGRLDIVFANAGINGVWAPLDEITPDEWDTTLAINLKGTFLTVRAALPHLKERGGSVIVTSSVNGTRIFDNPGATAYSCSKAGQVAFVKMQAAELGRWNIRVNAICPGAIETNIGQRTQHRDRDEVKITETKKVHHHLGHDAGSPEEVARLVGFLAGDESSHISGSVIYIDAAASLL